MIFLSAYVFCLSANITAYAITRCNLTLSSLPPIGGRIMRFAQSQLHDPNFQATLNFGTEYLTRIQYLGLFGMGKIISTIENLARRLIGGQISQIEPSIVKMKESVDVIVKHEKLDSEVAKKCHEAIDHGLEIFQTAKTKLEQLKKTTHSHTKQIEELTFAMEQIPPQIVRIKKKIEEQHADIEQFTLLIKKTKKTLVAMGQRLESAIDTFIQNANTITTCTAELVNSMNQLNESWSNKTAPLIKVY